MRSWEWDPHDGISILIRRDTRELALCPPCAMWGHSEKAAICKQKRGSLGKKKQAFPHLDLGLSASRTIRFLCLNHPIHDIVMAVPEGTTGMSEWTNEWERWPCLSCSPFHLLCCCQRHMCFHLKGSQTQSASVQSTIWKQTRPKLLGTGIWV